MNQTAKLAWRENETPAEISAALRILEEEYPIFEGGRGLKLKFREIKGDATVSRVLRNRGEVIIEYTNLAGALRGVGTALAKLDGEEYSPFKKRILGKGRFPFSPRHPKIYLRGKLCNTQSLRVGLRV